MIKSINRYICIFLAGIIMLCSVAFSVSAEEITEKVDTSHAKSSILIEFTTGQVLYENNAQEKLPIASLTKIMCLLLWAEDMKEGALSFEDTVTCSSHANSMDGSVIWLEVGEQMSVHDLIKSVVISSANDACVALAENSEGSEKAFVKRMNERAAQLGMKNTNFENCVGYDSDNHYSTAYDIAIVTSELMKYDYFSEFMLTRLDNVRQGERETQLLNTNKLINSYNGIVGGKTGTTDNAGNCFSGCAKRGDLKLVSVVLGCKETEQRFDISESLLDYGFAGFEMFTPKIDSEKLTPIIVENGVSKQINVRVRKLFSAVIPKGFSSQVTYDYILTDKLTAPVDSGTTVGKLTIMLSDEIIFESDIVAVETVEQLTFWKSFLFLLQSLFSM